MISIVINEIAYLCRGMHTELSDIQTFSTRSFDLILEDVYSIDGGLTGVSGGSIRFHAYQPEITLETGADEEPRP